MPQLFFLNLITKIISRTADVKSKQNLGHQTHRSPLPNKWWLPTGIKNITRHGKILREKHLGCFRWKHKHSQRPTGQLGMLLPLAVQQSTMTGIRHCEKISAVSGSVIVWFLKEIQHSSGNPSWDLSFKYLSKGTQQRTAGRTPLKLDQP